MENNFRKLNARKLSAGQTIRITYHGYNDGVVNAKVLGLSSKSKAEDGMEFQSVKEAMQEFDVTSLTKLDEVASEKTGHFYLFVETIGESENYTFGVYVFNGRFSIGSGADPCSFEILLTDEEVELEQRMLDLNELKKRIAAKERSIAAQLQLVQEMKESHKELKEQYDYLMTLVK